MKIYLILLPILYLIVSYISIFKMKSMFVHILRIIMGILLLFVVAIIRSNFLVKIGGYLLYCFFL